METKAGPFAVVKSLLQIVLLGWLLLGWPAWDSVEMLETVWVEKASPTRLVPSLLYHVLKAMSGDKYWKGPPDCGGKDPAVSGNYVAQSGTNVELHC